MNKVEDQSQPTSVRQDLVEASREFARSDLHDALGMTAVGSLCGAATVVAACEGRPALGVFFGAGAFLAGIGVKSSIEQMDSNLDGALRLSRNAR